MNVKKKSMAICLILSLVFSLIAFPAMAANNQTKEIFGVSVKSEKDMYINWLNSTDKELENQGYSKEQIAEIRSLDFEGKFTELSNMSTQELTQKGYSIQEIDLLHQYSGEMITAESEVLNVLSSNDLTTWFIGSTEYPCSSTQIGILYHWRWDDDPLMEFTDAVAVSWKALDQNLGYPEADVIHWDSEGNRATKVTLRYADKDTETIVNTEIKSMNENGVDNVIHTSFALNGDSNTYVKSGTVQLVLEANNFLFNSVLAAGSYGHSIVTFSQNLSYEVKSNLEISFSPIAYVDTTVSPQVRIYPNGTVVD